MLMNSPFAFREQPDQGAVQATLRPFSVKIHLGSTSGEATIFPSCGMKESYP